MYKYYIKISQVPVDGNRFLTVNRPTISADAPQDSTYLLLWTEAAFQVFRSSFLPHTCIYICSFNGRR